MRAATFSTVRSLRLPIDCPSPWTVGWSSAAHAIDATLRECRRGRDCSLYRGSTRTCRGHDDLRVKNETPTIFYSFIFFSHLQLLSLPTHRVVHGTGVFIGNHGSRHARRLQRTRRKRRRRQEHHRRCVKSV